MMVNEFCGFRHGVIGTDKMPADTTLNNMKKADLIKLLHTAQHNYESLMWFYNNAVKVNMSQLNNNGWIPCSERVPKDEELSQRKEVIVQNIHGEVFTAQYTYNCAHTRKDFFGGYCAIPYIVAWQPLPAPYQPKEGDK